MPTVEKKRIGLLVPARNRTMEDDFSGWMPQSMALNTMRMYFPPTEPATMAERLQIMDDQVGESARMIALVRPDVIAFGCTSGSFLHGLGWDLKMIEEVQEAAGGIPAVATARCVVDALNELGVKKIAAASPYPPEVNERLKKYLGEAGFDVVNFDYEDGRRVGNVDLFDTDLVYELGKRVDRAEAEAIFISCTNLRAASIIERLEKETGKPVVTSNQATFWACLRKLGVDESIPGAGKLLRERVPA
jgi:arylmalonate decarboxylase